MWIFLLQILSYSLLLQCVICFALIAVSYQNLYLVQLVVSTGSGVNGFTLDPSLGEFILTHPDIKVFLDPNYSSKIHSLEMR